MPKNNAKSLGRLVFQAMLLGNLAAASAQDGFGDMPPGTVSVDLGPVTTEESEQYIQARRLPPDLNAPAPGLGSQVANAPQMAAGLGGGTAPEAPASIAVLARALKNNPDLIYQYVRNNIEYYPGWGLQKGALGAIIENQGTAFDQASLMVSLLRQAGYTAHFVKGRVGLTAAQVREWLGLPTTDACAVLWVFAMGGVPTPAFSGTLPNGTCPANAPGKAGALVGLQIDHVWVKVSINGAYYAFDPSFKPHTLKSGINLPAITQFAPATYLGQAKAGATLTANYIQGINRSNIRANLTTYANRLAAYLRTNLPAGTLGDVLGGKTIVPYHGSALRQTGLPYQTNAPVTEWTADIPANYKATLNVQYNGINRTYTSDALYGKRLTITYDTANRPVLRLDGAVQATGSAVAVDTNPGNDPKVKFAIGHPFNGVNLSFAQGIEPGGTYLVSNGWGPTGNGLIEHHRKRLEQAKASGLKDASEPVLGSNLGILSATWLAQTNASLHITNRMSNTSSIFHHQVGIAGYHKSSYVDLPGNTLSTVSLAGNAALENAVFFSASGHGSIYESLAVQQTSGVSAVSTVKLIDMAAAAKDKIFNVTGTNYAGAVKPNLVGCEASLSAFQNAVTTTANHPGHRLILPSRCNLKEGIWTGAGYFDILASTNGSSIGAIISGGLHGGFGSTPVSTPTFTSNAINSISQAAITTANNLATTFGDPVDMAKGDYLYSHEDINAGIGAFPQALVFSRLYSSGSRTQDGPLGKGWTHSFAAKAALASNSFQGLGEDSALDAVAALAEHMVALSLFADPAKPLDKMVIATIGQRWFADTQVNNTVVVKQGLSGEIFVKLPDGSYNAPPGSSGKLARTADGTFTYDTLHHNQLKFNAAGNIAAYTDASGVQAKFAYTGNKLAAVTNSLGRSLAFTYTGNRISQAKDGGHTVKYAYDAGGNLTSYTDAAAQKTVFKYAAPGRMAQVFYPANPTLPFVTNAYDALGRVATQKNASGQAYSYFFAGSRSEERDPLGNSKVSYLDAFGKVLRSTDPRGYTTVNSYDGQERLAATVFPEGNAVQYQYDDAPCAAQKRCTHNVKAETKVAKPGSGLANLVDTYAYEGSYNQLSAHTSPGGKTTRYTYNRGQLATVTRPPDAAGVSRAATYGYTRFAPAGFAAFILPTSVTEPISATDAVTTTTAYLAANKYVPKATVVDAGAGKLNLTTSYAYDAYGNLHASNGPRTDVADTVTTDYDAERRPVQVTNALGKATRLRYNADGRLTVTAAQLGAQWSVSCRNYHPGGNLKTAWGPGLAAAATTCPTVASAPPVISYAYDPLDRLSRTTQYLTVPQGGNRITDTLYYPDNTDQAVKSAVGTGLAQATATYTYTPNGLPATVKDAEGNLTTYAYDGHGRKARAFYPDQAVANLSSSADYEQYGYDADGNLTRLRKRDGQEIGYRHDNLGRLLAATHPDPADNPAYSYALLGRRTRADKPGYAVSYAWDRAGRLASTTAGGRALSHRYDPAGNRTRTAWPDAAYFTTTSYDALNRPTAIKERGTANLASYAYDDLSRRKAATLGNATATAYAYTASAALASLSHNLAGSARDIAWGLPRNQAQELTGLSWSNDAYQWQGYTNGTRSYNANGLNQYGFAGPAALTYDRNGNLTGDGTWSYRYDLDNRLTGATKAGLAAALGYDAAGRLHSFSAGGGVAHQLYDGDRLVADYDGNGALLRRYVHGPGVDEPIVQYQGPGLAAKAWLYADPQGSIVAAADGAGIAQAIHSYGPYGEPDRDTGLKFRYTGQQLLGPLGLYYYKARMYSPTLGRFLQPDPIGYQGGMNLYAYVGNDPINFADPSGLRAGEIKGTISDQFRDVGQLVQQRPQVLSPFAAVLAVPGASQALAVGAVASGEMPLPSVKFNNLAPNDPIGYANTFSANKIIQQEYSGKLNYVVNTDSKLILGKSPHISLSGGADVFAAGEAKFVNGQLKYINNDSGHYKPSGATAETSATNAFSNAGFNSLNKYFEKH